MEKINNICVINPQSIKTLEGMSVEEKYIIFECEGKQCWALLKWRGIINNSINCLGCDIKIKSNIGTNGTFVNQSIFKCDYGCGVLIPLDRIDNCCVTEGHKKLSINNNTIKEKTICCIKPTKESKLNTRIEINERIRKINGKETGIFKWVGLVNEQEVIGLDSKNLDKEGTNGTFCGVKLFNCDAKCGALFDPVFFECELKRIEDIGVNIIDPFHVKSIENGSLKEIRKIMYLKRKVGKKIINIKWRGIVNRHLCVGCELANISEYGTNGTFGGERLFNCGDGKAILIPVDELGKSCEAENHKKIVKIDGFINRLYRDAKCINPDNICCVEWLTTINKLPELQIDGRIKYKNQDIYGTCKWMGLVNGKEAVGVEMDLECKGTNGRFSSFDLFNCMNSRGLLFTADDIEYDSEKIHFVFDKIGDTNKIFIVKPLSNINRNRNILGNPVMIEIGNKTYVGEVKWMGIINNEDCVGLDMEDPFECGMDGIIRTDSIFDCMRGHGLITPLTNVKLCEDGLINPQFIMDGLMNPNKYLKCEVNWNNEFLIERNVKKDEFVFVKLKNKIKIKGTLRWCGLMNKLPVGIVELTLDHEYGTNGMFWRSQLLECPDKRAIAVTWNNIFQYSPYERKEIPKDDRNFPEIDINSVVKYCCTLNNDVEERFGTVKWTGVDEDGKYLYGLEMEDIISDGTDGEFNGQRLFQCRPCHGLLSHVDRIFRDTRFVEEHKFLNRSFLDLYKRSNEPYLDIRSVKDLVQVNDERLMKLFVECKDRPLKLDANQHLIPMLIQEDDIASIKLIIDNCDLTPVSNQTFLNLAYFAMKKNDDNLFDFAIEHCQDKNGILENGETFITNLIQDHCTEEQINKIISKDIFDLQVTNKKYESPFMVACQKGMLSIVEKLIPKSFSSNQKQEAINMLIEANENLTRLGRSYGGFDDLCKLINNTETN